MYSIEQLPNGGREAVLSVEGIIFKSRDNVDVLYPVRPVPGMALRIYVFPPADCAPGEPAFVAWDDNEWLAGADSAEALLAKVRLIMIGRMLDLVATYNSLFRLDVPEGPAKLSL